MISLATSARGLIFLRMSIRQKEDLIIRGRSGDFVPFPVGKINPIKYEIAAVGLKAVDTPFSDCNPFWEDLEMCRLHYIYNRHSLLMSHFGKWVAFDKEGMYIVGTTERMLLDFIDRKMPPRSRDHVIWNCIGCEILEMIDMDDGGGYVDEEVPLDYANVDLTLYSTIQRGKKGTELWIRGDYSEDGGKTFLPAPWMKYGTGADMMGVPSRVLSNPQIASPHFQRDGEIYCQDGRGKITKANIYKDFYIKINGLTTRTRAVVSPRWLAGFPIWSRYRTVIDLSINDYLTMEKLSSEEDHPPGMID